MATKNVALPHGKSKKTTKSALVVRERTAIGRQPGSRTFDSSLTLPARISATPVAELCLKSSPLAALPCGG
jgi:hypothetical protein